MEVSANRERRTCSQESPHSRQRRTLRASYLLFLSPFQLRKIGSDNPSVILDPEWLRPGLFLALLSLGFLLLGCGYTFGLKSRTIGVLAFSNETFKPGVEILARDLISQKLAERRVSLIDGQGADLMLKGAILSYSTQPVAFDVQDISRQYRLTISLSISLRDRGKEKALWEETLTASSYYYTGPDVAATEISEKKASNRVLEELAQLVASRLTGVF